MLRRSKLGEHMDNTFDKLYYSRGENVAGIDESGVSDIAGPLVAACVILPKLTPEIEDLRIFSIDDCKKIPEKYRRDHVAVIWEISDAIGIGEVVPMEIDFLGKRKATILAMVRAIANCQDKKKRAVEPDFLMIDGNIPLPVNIEQECIKDGDCASLSIAAASLVAKVWRDDTMASLHRSYPHYDWIRNKGHPCEKHFRGIDNRGIVPGVHRTRFWPFVANKERRDDEKFWDVRRGLWRTRSLENLIAESLGQEKILTDHFSKQLEYSQKTRRQKKFEKDGNNSKKDT